MTIRRKLHQSLQDKTCIRLQLNREFERVDGIAVHISPDIVVVKEVLDFQFDGIMAVPLSAVKSVERDSVFKTWDAVLRHSNEIKKLKVPKWILKCETLVQIFEQLYKRDIWPSVDLVDGPDSWFFIGKLLHVEEAGFNIRPYSGDGKWQKQVPVAMDVVEKVSFNDQYGRHFSKYMRSRLAEDI